MIPKCRYQERSRKIELGRKIILIVCWAAFVSGKTTQAEKAVFIISKHPTPGQAQAYIIEGDQVDYQAQVDIDTYNPGFGA